MKITLIIIGLCLLPWVLGALAYLAGAMAGLFLGALVAGYSFVEAVWKAVKP